MGARRGWPRVVVAALATGMVCGVLPLPAAPRVAAQETTCMADVEPNDAPEDRPPVTGPLCVEGTLPSGDQDIVAWDLPPGDPPTTWTVTVDGVVGTLTSLRLIPVASEPGVVPMVAGNQVLQVDAPPEALDPVVRDGLLLPSGRLIVGISRSAMADGTEPRDTSYRFSIVPRAPLAASGDIEPNDGSDTASPVADAFEIGGDAMGNQDYFTWTVAGTPQGQSWLLRLQGTVGRGLGMTLYGPDGSDLVWGQPDADGLVVIPDLQLVAGMYRVLVSGSPAEPSPYQLSAALVPLPADPEPNDQGDEALPFDLGARAAEGRLFPSGDRDQYRLTIPADEAPTLRDIRVVGAPDLRRQVCLTRLDGSALQCREGPGGAALRSVVLPAGDYLVAVSGDPDPDRGYVLRIEETATALPGYETEPNDDPSVATPFDPAMVMHGFGGTGDADYFHLTTAGDAQLWEVRVSGTSVDRLALTRPDGQVLAEGFVDPEHAEALLTDLYLVPGEHWFRVDGQADYQIVVSPLGPPDPNAEREPNDSVAFAQPYRLGRADLVGRLPTPADSDVLRFSLAGPERITLLAEPPPDGSIAMSLETDSQVLSLRRAGEPGAPVSIEALLEPGDYEVWLRPGVPSSGRYRFSLQRGDPFATRADEEPNDRLEQARPLSASLVAVGTLPSGDDFDWYELPEIDPSTPVRITFSGGVTYASLTDGTSDLSAAWDPAALVLSTDGTAGIAPRFLKVSGSGPYALALEAAGLVPVPPLAPLPVRATLSLGTDTVAAYWPAGQRVTGSLELANDGSTPISLSLDSLTSHYAWIAGALEAEVQLGAGEARSVPVEVAIGPDAWADDPVLITFRARAEDGAATTASASVTPRRDADPVAPEQAWSVPPPLLGGLDVASLALGAVTMPSIDQAQEDQLHDGVAHVDTGFVAGAEQLPITLTVDLAGDAPVQVAGFALDPLAGYASPGDVPRDVELLLSTDGVTFTPALRATLTPLMADQWFVLDEPMPATYAQLRILSTHGGGYGRVSLGEWKVVASPGSSPGDAVVDLAQPVRGGHVAWISPQASAPETGRQWLDEDPTWSSFWLEKGASVSWAIGFQDDRVAQVTRLEWVDPVPSTPGQRFRELAVDVSLDGAAGPWRSLGTWRLDRASDGSVARFAFPEGTWARYVRLSGTGPAKADGPWDPPSTMRIFERPTSADYRSILGQWGNSEPDGPYEWLIPPDVTAPPAQIDDNDTPETADPITPGVTASGRIDGGNDVDWYAFTVPDGHNSLELTVTGRPIVMVALTLVDDQGFEVPMLFSAGDAAGTVRYEAEVSPGATYRLKVEQPPSSIVFTFDTSGSMGAYLDYVYQGLRAFTADVTRGQEFVSIVPFEEDPLLGEWSDDPFLLQDAVDRFVALGGSSSAETALINAANALSTHEGARAVLLVTDAETSSFERTAELWQVLASVRPMVFAVHVGATLEPPVSTALMQDWARVAGGVYQYTRSHGEMDRAFDRLATWLRRPAGYALDLSTTFRAKPPPSARPGTIAVISPKDRSTTISSDVGVEIILDTSGSMLKRIGGKRRIDLAKTVLADVVANRLPAGAPVAVRVLGDATDACGTRLLVPLGPLDPARVIGRVDAIDVVQAADTPLGQALRAVPEDLGRAKGTRIVLLITDSEEVWPNPDLCGQDPAAAVRDLRRRGIDARLNIVGLQVNARKATTQLRKWARLGNGTFFQARDAAGLGHSIRTALSAPFRVLDANGNEVASGTVDGSGVPVKPGVYSIVVLSDPVVRFDAVKVKPGGGQRLRIPDAPPPPSLEPLPSPGS